MDAVARFVELQTLVRNLRSVLPPLSPGQNALVGLYLYNAYLLGAGQPCQTFPVVRAERPSLHIIDGGH